MSLASPLPAIVTAGGRLTGALAEHAGTDLKALALVGDTTLLARVVRALRDSGQVGRIVVVGPVERIEAAAREAGADYILPEGETGPANIQIGLDALREEIGDSRVVLAATDVPFLDAEAVRWLVNAAGDTTADIVFPVIARADYERAFPGAPNVWTRLEGKDWTGGSVQIVRPAALEANRVLIERAFAARKSQWDMARLLGLNFAIRFKGGMLTIAQAERRASQIIGCECLALVNADPRLAADVDDLADYEWARNQAANSSGKEQTNGGNAVRGWLMPLLDEQFAEKAREVQQKTLAAVGDAQTLFREVQEGALDLARARAHEAQERARRAAEAMPPGLLVRLASSILGIPLLVFLAFAEGSPTYPALPFTCAVAICALLGGWELFRGLKFRGFRPSEGAAFVGIFLLQFAAWSVSRGLMTAFLPSLLAVLVIVTMIHQIMRREGEPLANIGVTFTGVVYVGWLFSYLIFLRSLPGAVDVWPFYRLPAPFNAWFHATGAWIVLYVMAVTWTTDAGAYFVGMNLGKTPLAPRLSPKKTREGAFGGLVAAALMSLAWGTWIGLPWGHCLILGPAIGALGQIGDLCESALKRDLGIKDFGGVLPGHGGILDRFDSLLFTAPVAYYYLVFIVPHL